MQSEFTRGSLLFYLVLSPARRALGLVIGCLAVIYSPARALELLRIGAGSPESGFPKRFRRERPFVAIIDHLEQFRAFVPSLRHRRSKTPMPITKYARGPETDRHAPFCLIGMERFR